MIAYFETELTQLYLYLKILFETCHIITCVLCLPSINILYFSSTYNIFLPVLMVYILVDI